MVATIRKDELTFAGTTMGTIAYKSARAVARRITDAPNRSFFSFGTLFIR
jgi:hypothetical protein